MAAGKRIAWRDSAGMPSRIHRTLDEGLTTVCGHQVPTADGWDPERRGRWQVTADVPRRIRGGSRYCLKCFAEGGKALPFLGA